MSASDHGRWSDELAAYALGALERDEADAFERHLAGCERCREELRWLQPAVQTLPESVERTEPPPQLRESLMAAVRAEARQARERTEPAAPRRSRGWLLKPAAGLAVVALLVAGAVGYEVGKDGAGNGGGTTVERQVGGIDVKMVQEGNSGTLQLAGVPQLPPDKVLEAWVEREGKVEAVPALFVPDRHGKAEARIADMSDVSTVMVTEEPRGGSDQPTGEPIVAMAVPQ